MYEEAEPVRTPQAGSDRKQPSHDPPGRLGNTDGHVHRGKQACHENIGGQGTSSNVYEEAEVVKLKNISGDVPYGTDTSTDTDTTPHVGASVYCMVAALAVVVALAITGPILLMFINGGYNHEEDISHIPTTVGAFNLEHKQNQTAAMEQRLIEKTAAQCALLSPPLHGSVSGSNSYGDVVHFTCEQGYRLVGKSSLTCLSDGTWNGNSPTCIAFQCPSLSPPLHGSVSGSNSYGDVVHFTCDQGFRLVGKSSLTCLSDGTWNGNSPTCTATQKWRDDRRCGAGYTTADGSTAECDPDSIYPCCSPGYWCGNTADHCDCTDCVDYRDTASDTIHGYTVRAGDCPGNDIWSIFGDGMTLSDCADRCRSHPDCVSFMFFDNKRCFPKSKTCQETSKDNPKNMFYDKDSGCETARTDTVYRYRWEQRRLAGSRFTFAVQADNDAHVALSAQRRDLDDMYEIVIGGWANLWSVIRRSKQGDHHASALTLGINSPKQYRTFWITWSSDGTIAVGKGGKTQPFMQWRDPDPLPIAYAGYSTGWGSTGRWKFCHNAHLAAAAMQMNLLMTSQPPISTEPAPSADRQRAMWLRSPTISLFRAFGRLRVANKMADMFTCQLRFSTEMRKLQLLCGL
ncbi:hypothetical protein Bbelb_081540 [Branchiostoma belcheri]|nr:hypothetical protein Bbelb_081540 [Branchiostoma belcheri]